MLGTALGQVYIAPDLKRDGVGAQVLLLPAFFAFLFLQE